MEKAPHTPGPWVNFSSVSDRPKESVGYWCRGPGAWVCVADCSHERTGNGGAPGELEANARLIATAPDFKAAAEIAIVELEAVEREIGVPSKALPLLRAAMARARGES